MIVAEYNKDKDAAEIQKVMDDLFAVFDNLDEEAKRFPARRLAQRLPRLPIGNPHRPSPDALGELKDTVNALAKLTGIQPFARC